MIERLQKIKRKYNRAIIVGAGPSAKSFYPPDDIAIIAINGAIEWLPRADCWFTLDDSSANLQRMRNKMDGVYYAAAIDAKKLRDYKFRFPDVFFLNGYHIEVLSLKLRIALSGGSGDGDACLD